MTAGLTSRFDEALVYARRLHASQLRKGSNIPYISHLLAVTALVLENGGEEDQAIIALLHDAAEDQGGLAVIEAIQEKFGERVAAAVESLSDTFEDPKPAWRPRKERYLDHLRMANEDVVLVSLADKLHNARSILRDLRLSGPEVWKRFRGGKEGTLWYYRSLIEIFQQVSRSVMVAELAETVAQIELRTENEEAGNEPLSRPDERSSPGAESAESG